MQSEMAAFFLFLIFINDMVRENLIEKIVSNVILEYSGVSDKVTNISKEIMRLIMQENSKRKWLVEWFDDNKKYKCFSLPIEGTIVSEIANEVLVKLYGYGDDVTFDEEKAYLVKHDMLNMAFSPSVKRIKLFVPFPCSGVLDETAYNYLMYAINHEVKHALQSHMRGGTKITSAYLNSTKPVKLHGDDHAYNLMKFYIRDLYYNFDIDEIDAHLQELYIQLNDNNGDLSKCKAYTSFKECVTAYNWLKNDVMYPKKGSFEVSYYSKQRAIFDNVLLEMLGGDISKKQFFAYCSRGIRRFKEHMRRIIGRYKSENGGNTGSFKNYSQNEIPQSGMFSGKKMKPEIWRKLLRQYNKARYHIK